MKIVAFSDVHGNAYALNEFIKRISELEYDKLVFLGDIFGYYYEQKDCIEALKRIPDLVWLKGNHDDYAVRVFNGKIDEKKLISSFGHSYANIQEKIEGSDMSMISELSSSYVLKCGGKKIGFFHGSPNNELEGRIYMDTELQEDDFKDFDILILGHTHHKMIRTIGEKKIINPGSLGQPRDGKGYGFMLFDTESEECEFINVSVDNTLLKQQIDANDSGLYKLYDVLGREG